MSALRRLAAPLRRRSIQITIGLWILANIIVAAIAAGPFDHPDFGGLSLTGMLIGADINMVAVLALIALTYRLTRKRAIPDLATRAPQRRVAAREVAGLIGYGVLVQIVGALLGAALGWHPIGFHLAGTLYGHQEVTPAEAYTWAGYNFLAYAVAPYLYFRRRYSAEALGLRSSNRRNDLLVIGAVLLVESLSEFAGLSTALFDLSPRQVLLGAPFTFVLYLLGTVLPTMIFIYAILLPRYRKLTGSTFMTIILAGITYALVHALDAWTVLTSPTGVVLSVTLLFLQYFGPGMVKAVLTLRTGNAWVHVWAYHAISPHTIIDTPHMVEMLQIKP